MKLKALAWAVGLGMVAMTTGAKPVALDNGQRTESDLKRDVTSKPDKIIEFAGITEGMIVLDVLGGGGYYSELLSQAVGAKGKVYLHNNQAYLKFIGDELVARVKDGRLSNVVDYKREADALGLSDNSLDAVFFVLGYHDLYHVADDWKVDPNAFVSQLNKALKPGGLLLIVDHSASDGSGTSSAQKLHRIDQEYVKNELVSKGFVFVKSSEILRNPNDSRVISPFRPEIRRQTDRFVQLYRKNNGF